MAVLLVQEGMSPLLISCLIGDSCADGVKALLETGADPNGNEQVDNLVVVYLYLSHFNVMVLAKFGIGIISSTDSCLRWRTRARCDLAFESRSKRQHTGQSKSASLK